MKRRATILVAFYQGYPGDTISFLMPILSRLVERGHVLRIIFGPGVRQTRLPVNDRLLHRLADMGATIVPFRDPESHPWDSLPPVSGLIRDWIPSRSETFPGKLRRSCGPPPGPRTLRRNYGERRPTWSWQTMSCWVPSPRPRRRAFLLLRFSMRSARDHSRACLLSGQVGSLPGGHMETARRTGPPFHRSAVSA